MKISAKKTVQVDVKEVRLYLKVADMFTAGLYDSAGEQVAEQEDGYVPDLMPGEHYGDYVILNIDLETGMVTNWKKPTVKQVEAWIAKMKGDEDDS